uniref:Uncharacterized protein n=1 Tax=Siphoviridae sp. ctt1f11 TaxID=2827959 RepID=A0A8S5SCR1_9CAUD|nr:MAG TPA: hypothetical protein [Siphoviridae sp. ctt1f11]
MFFFYLSNSCYCRYLPIFADIGVAPNVAPIAHNSFKTNKKRLGNVLTVLHFVGTMYIH